MGLWDTIEQRMTDAIRAKDAQTVSVLRMLKSRIQQKKTEKGFSGDLTDDIVTGVIVAYHKSLKKAYDEYSGYPPEKVGDKLEQLQAEMAVLDRYVPSMLDEEATLALVKEAIAATGAEAPAHVGKVMGYVMKDHKGEVEPSLVKRLAAGELGGS